MITLIVASQANLKQNSWGKAFIITAGKVSGHYPLRYNIQRLIACLQKLPSPRLKKG